MVSKRKLYAFSDKRNLLFPPKIGDDTSATLFKFGLKRLHETFGKSNKSWNPYLSSKIIEKDNLTLDKIPVEGFSPKEVISEMVRKFFNGIPNWRSPHLQYNICAPVNVVSQTMLSLAQEMNIHNINNDFAGNCLLAESIVSGMMADLVNLPKKQVKALFSFGGTASNMYAMKIAINKAIPEVGNIGMPSNVYVLITRDAHFSHKTVADWLGIGVNHAVQIEADAENRSIVSDAETKAREILEKGGILAGISLNGGPFYDFAVDDVSAFVKLRSKLISDYKLSYTPHIHVDTVIGWIWLMFNKYDFKKNPLDIPFKILSMIQKQFKRVYKIRLADSWGVDFHKALGGCPTPCGLFVSNNGKDILCLSKSQRGICDTHHLGGDWSIDDPSDITLETSRSAGPALAALSSLLTMGRNGFRSFLANQINTTKKFRDQISSSDYFLVGNPQSLGFNTMLVLIPGELQGKAKNWESFLSVVENNEQLLTDINQKLKSFYGWCLEKSNDYNKRLGCSFSKSFHKATSGDVSGLKYCFVSPHMGDQAVKSEIQKLEKQFGEFSESIKKDV